MESFAAKYYDGQAALSHAVICQPTPQGLSVSGATVKDFHWRFADMTADSDGAFFHADRPDAQLIPESSAAAALLLKKLPRRKRGKENMRVVTYCLVLIAVVVAMVFWVIPALSPYILSQMPPHWDERLGNYAMQRFSSSTTECSDPAGKAALNKVVAHLTADLNSPYTYRVIAVRSPMVNAFALPGGQMLVFGGLIDNTEHQNEIFGVMAHEIAHGEKRHGTENLVRTLATTLVVDVLTGGGGSLFYIGTQLHDMDYSRKKEAEADDFALNLLEQKGIDPRGLANFFARLEKKEKQPKSERFDKLLEFISTHPGNAERMKNANAHYDEKKLYRNYLSDIEWQALKRICRKKKS